MSDEAAPEVLTESVQTTMENTTPVDTTVSDISSIIPAEYADKGWVKDVKDINGLFKLTDGLKSEMGKRPGGIPQETASDEDKAAFYTELGVPESVDGYDLGEGDADYQKGIRDLFHKANITADQAKMLAEGNAEIIKGLTPDAAAQDAAFDKIAEDTFGERRDEVLSTAKLLLAENVKDLSPEMQEHVNNLPNKELIVMASVLDKIKEKYINEDSLPASNQAKAATAEDSRKKGYELMQSKAWTDRSHPDHARVAAEIARIYGT
jgi:hypothetical protein